MAKKIVAGGAPRVGAGFDRVRRASSPVACRDLGRHSQSKFGIENDGVGLELRPPGPDFLPWASANTEIPVTSEPVPAVVGTAITGRRFAGSGVSQS